MLMAAPNSALAPPQGLVHQFADVRILPQGFGIVVHPTGLFLLEQAPGLWRLRKQQVAGLTQDQFLDADQSASGTLNEPPAPGGTPALLSVSRRRPVA